MLNDQQYEAKVNKVLGLDENDIDPNAGFIYPLGGCCNNAPCCFPDGCCPDGCCPDGCCPNGAPRRPWTLDATSLLLDGVEGDARLTVHHTQA